jgi:NodT family efflux transporter outer membrane factor (OMF) lipoprotein
MRRVRTQQGFQMTIDAAPNPFIRLTPLALALSLALALAGCASPGPEVTPLARLAPATLGLATPTAEPAVGAGWSALGDPRLSELIETALRDHPSMAGATARVNRAVALAQRAHADELPTVGLGAEVNRQRYSANGLFPAPIGGGTWNLGTVQVGASWAPDFFGQQAAELSAALGQAKAAQADRAAAALGLSTQIARAYIGLARLLAQREVAERLQTQRAQLQQLTRERVAAGLDTRVEQVQADGALPNSRVQLEALDEQISLLRHQLAALTGQGPQSLNPLSPVLASLRLPTLPATLGADLLGRRPEVVAARWRIESAVDDVAVARADFYPNINLGAVVGLNAVGLDRVFKADSRQFGVTPALSLPIFEGGRLRAQLKSHQAGLDMAVAQYNGLVLDAVHEAADALGSVQSLARQAVDQQAVLQSTQSAHELAQLRQQAGLANALQVLAAELPWLAQRGQVADLRARQLDASIALIKALGGGWVDDTATVSQATSAP